MKVPAVGMRNIKTAVAVMVCFFLYIPLQGFFAGQSGGYFSLMSPFYSCISAVICMQSSVKQSVHQGVYRLIGTLIGGVVGILFLYPYDFFTNEWFLGILLCLGIIATIWLCNLIGKPTACSIACVVLCVVMLNHSGTDRYVYTLIRMAQTAVGIVVAVLVNHLLPDHQGEEHEPPKQHAPSHPHEDD
ncbi:MAG: FUSC family protein [Oscillospiraceae bacterium]